jgi:SAM-dependent methyltransferase
VADRVADEYRRILAHCESNAALLPPYLVQQSRDWTGETYLAAYRGLLGAIPAPLSGKRAVDFGCKYGHLAPLLLAHGCTEVIGVDAQADYVDAGNALFGTLYSNVRLVRSEEGLIPVQPDAADLVIMNEVISHVNPAFLDTIWRETARILSRGGLLFISDGNNAANPMVQRVLPELYAKWENGPDGAPTDRDVVTTSFVNRRKAMIRERYPGLQGDEVDFVAENTSGLFGTAFLRTVDDYVRTKALIRRPYRYGDCPVSPEASGIVMERGFHPAQLELALAEYGFAARQLKPALSFGGAGLRGLVRGLRDAAKHLARRATNRDWYRSLSEGFQLVAIKVR